MSCPNGSLKSPTTAPGVPFLLIGTKSDFRNNKEMKAELEAQGLSMVSPRPGFGCRTKINAVKYLECSALSRENVDKVFDDAVRVVLSKPSKRKNNGRCALL
eukprot:GABV01002195.1.p2 GENE.GABV01002195.1~~GABV01002195.1.p2  ORF type:complete len:102 (-),score=33.95 GABV01002195.1:94-399(-)